MAFRKKHESILRLKPDLLFIQECENESKLKDQLEAIGCHQVFWQGNNPNKGLAVFSFNQIALELSDSYHPEYEYIIPLTFKYNNRKINLFHIWAMPHKSERSKNYVGQIWGAIKYYKHLLNEDSILIGDFNSNAIWDNKKKNGNHSDVVRFLAEKNIHSIYHDLHQINHGVAEQATLYLLKNIQKPYHMDYCFVSKNLYSKNTTFEIGVQEDWLKLSDHMPIVIDGLVI